MNRHSLLTFWTGRTKAAHHHPHQLNNQQHRPVVVVTAKPKGGRLSPRSLLRASPDPAEEKKDDNNMDPSATATAMDTAVEMALPSVIQVVARSTKQLPTRRFSHGEIPLQVQVETKIDDNNNNNEDEKEEEVEVAAPVNVDDNLHKPSKEQQQSTTLLMNDASNGNHTATTDGVTTAAATTAGAAPSLQRTGTNATSPSPPTTSAVANQEKVRRSSSSSAPVTLQEIRERRRSSRKSVNGLIIEFDLNNESDRNLFGDCEDYEEDLRPDLTRQDSNESLEQLRTRLEALEHERQSEELPEHDEDGLGEECMNKNLMEALENSSSSLQNDSGADRNANLAAFHNSYASLSGGGMSLMGILEFSDEEDEEGDLRDATKGDGGNPNHSRDDECDSISSKAQRRSTARLSINGLVLEYDLSGSEDDEEEEEKDEEEDLQ